MDSTLLGGLIGVGATLAGVALAEGLAHWREARQRQEEQRDLAGALAAELRGLLVHLREVAPREDAQPEAMVWAAESAYFPVFDNIGPKLLVLPQKLAEDVVACYVRCKAALDSYRLACRLGEQVGQTAGDRDPMRWRSKVVNFIASTQAQEAADYAAALAESLEDDLLPRLDEAAQGKH